MGIPDRRGPGRPQPLPPLPPASGAASPWDAADTSELRAVARPVCRRRRCSRRRLPARRRLTAVGGEDGADARRAAAPLPPTSGRPRQWTAPRRAGRTCGAGPGSGDAPAAAVSPANVPGAACAVRAATCITRRRCWPTSQGRPAWRRCAPAAARPRLPGQPDRARATSPTPIPSRRSARSPRPSRGSGPSVPPPPGAPGTPGARPGAVGGPGAPGSPGAVRRGATCRRSWSPADESGVRSSARAAGTPRSRFQGRRRPGRCAPRGDDAGRPVAGRSRRVPAATPPPPPAAPGAPGTVRRRWRRRRRPPRGDDAGRSRAPAARVPRAARTSAAPPPAAPGRPAAAARSGVPVPLRPALRASPPGVRLSAAAGRPAHRRPRLHGRAPLPRTGRLRAAAHPPFGARHPAPEWQILHELRDMNVPPQQVLELHTELESCELPGGYCARMIRETWPQVRITHTAPYGRDHASRQQGMRHLLEHQGELHQVADGPARPAPVRVPLPPQHQIPPAPPIPPEADRAGAACRPSGRRASSASTSARSRGRACPTSSAQTLVWAGAADRLQPVLLGAGAAGPPGADAGRAGAGAGRAARRRRGLVSGHGQRLRPPAVRAVRHGAHRGRAGGGRCRAGSRRRRSS